MCLAAVCPLGSGDGFGVSGCSPLLGTLLSLAAAHWDCATPSCSGWCFRNSCYACQQRIPVLPWAMSTPVSQPRDTGDSQCSNPAQPQPVRGRAAWGRTPREPWAHQVTPLLSLGGGSFSAISKLRFNLSLRVSRACSAFLTAIHQNLR